MREYFRSIWNFRYFWMSLVRMDLRSRYRRSVIGMGWSLLHPIALTTTICVVFHQIFQVDIRHFAPYLLAGIATWGYIVSSTLSGCESYIQAESYIRQCPAPMAIYPLRTTLGTSIHFLLAMSVVLVMAVFFKPEVFNLVALATLPATLVMLFAFCWSLAVLGGLMNVFFPDTKHLFEVGFQILFYLTPVMWETRMVSDPFLALALQCNPLVHVLALIREPIIYGRVPSLMNYCVSCGLVAFFLTSASYALYRLQRKVVFYL
ncbi:MAG: sugar ABC transporter permease [Gemmatales bacterium]|nr:MAG: sugar ABC transporter permease [Gemmatales bacterium]